MPVPFTLITHPPAFQGDRATTEVFPLQIVPFLDPAFAFWMLHIDGIDNANIIIDHVKFQGATLKLLLETEAAQLGAGQATILGELQQQFAAQGALLAQLATLPDVLGQQLLQLSAEFKARSSDLAAAITALTALEPVTASQVDQIVGGRVAAAVDFVDSTVISEAGNIRTDAQAREERIVQAIMGAAGGVAPEVSALTSVVREFVRVFVQGALPDLVQTSAEIAALRQVEAGDKRVDFTGETKGLFGRFEDLAEKNRESLVAAARAYGLDVEAAEDIEVLLGAMPNLRGLLSTKGILSKVPTNPLWYLGLQALLEQYLNIDVAEIARDLLPSVSGPAAHLAESLGESVMRGIGTVHRPMRAVMQTGAQLFLGEIERELEALGEASPDTVIDNAVRLFAEAGSLGMSAHLLALAYEKVDKAKHLGFPQLAAFLVDMSGFQGIARNSIGVQFEAALRSPALRRANARFRPELPDGGSFVQMFLERRVNEQTARQFYAERGWSDELISAHLATVFKEPSPREMAMVFEDGEIDQGWGFRMLQQVGFEDDDAERLLKGVITRAHKSPRQAFIGAVVDNVEQGIIEEEAARAILRDVPLGDEATALMLGAAAHRRLRFELTDQRKLLEDAAANGAITDEDLAANLAALGYDARMRQQAVSRARLRRGVHLFKDEEADRKAAVRRAQTDSVTAAMEAHRRFVIDDGGLHAALVATGIPVDEADALVTLARVRREPTPKLPEVLTEERQAQEELKLAQRRVLELQGKKLLTQAESVSMQQQLGVSAREAQLEAALVDAKIAAPPDVAKPPTATEVESETRRVRTDAAVDLFRAHTVDEAGLLVQLKAAGNPDKVAAGIVAREKARRQLERVRAVAAENAQALERTRKALEDAAVIAFRDGRIDEADLLQHLLVAGRPLAVAEVIVEREKERAAVAPARSPSP